MPKERNPIPDRKFRLSALELLLLTAIVVGLAFMIRIVVAPGTVMDSRLSATVSQLEQRMMEVSEVKIAAEPGGELTERLNRLEQKVGELERRLEEQGRGTTYDGVALIRDSPQKTAISEQTGPDLQR